MRLDKFLAECNQGTRSEVKVLLKSKRVTVNGVTENSGKRQINEFSDVVCLDEKKLTYQSFAYYMLNKPKDVITATEDSVQKTVLDLIDKKDCIKGLFPVGRLDKDTTGLVLLTNDGALAHNLLAPKKHVEKVYEAKIEGIVTEAEVELFSKPIELKNGEVTKPSRLVVKKADEDAGMSEIEITISEGKYHQIKRMFASTGMHVLELKRLKMGSLELDDRLDPGKYRALTQTEIEELKIRD